MPRLPVTKPSLVTLFAVVCASALLACGGGSDAPSTASGATPGPAPSPAPGPAPTPAPAPAPTPAGNHSIAGIAFAQSLVFPVTDPELVLAGDRAALVKVDVVAPTQPAAKPAGTVRITDAAGALLAELALNAPSGNLPSAPPARPSFADSYWATIPAQFVRAGIAVTPSFTPAATNSSSASPRVGGSVALRVVTVPVQIGSTVGQVVSDAENFLRARLPAAQVTRVDHAPMVSQQVSTLPTTADEWSAAFSRILGEIDDLRLLENAPSRTLYFGFIPKRGPGLSGVGYRPGNAAVGFDLPSSPTAVRETMVHEIGHNLSLRHAPCGDPSSPDPNYPYANAAMGAGNRFIWGYDAIANRFIDPTPGNVHDVMSYCSGNWFSDYNYRLMQVYLTPSDRTADADSGREQPAAAAASQELLVVSGEVDAQGRVRLASLKTTSGTPRPPEPGPWLLRITTQAGTVVERPFASREVDHDAARQRFGFTLAHPGAIERIEIVRDGRVVQQRAARARALAAAPAMALQASEQGGVLSVRWDAARQPYLTVTHLGSARTVVALDVQGGSATLPTAALPPGGRFELALSDGLNVERVLVDR
ncbi:MAG TPA: M66 family metalloprotease [Burkholderiaceae bacterium]|nr:M66 family metalloprotease [Burkholderiaceae bacterium]